jgi:SAM-dependent methyltransferase
VSEPRLYRELAGWWPLLSSPEEYADEAAVYRALLVEHAQGVVREVLELGSGGGNNASHLKASFELTLVDRSPQMLEVSRRLNPECEHVEGDMRSVRLERAFDAVFVHDAVAYLTTEDDLRAMFETAAVHCRPGGCALVVPDAVRETFRPFTDHGGHDGEGRALRYLEWTWDPDPSDDVVFMDLTYVLHEGDAVDVVHDRHVCGLFARDVWLRRFEEAGFDAKRIELPADPWPVGAEGFVGVRRG